MGAGAPWPGRKRYSRFGQGDGRVLYGNDTSQLGIGKQAGGMNWSGGAGKGAGGATRVNVELWGRRDGRWENQGKVGRESGGGAGGI